MQFTGWLNALCVTLLHTGVQPATKCSVLCAVHTVAFTRACNLIKPIMTFIALICSVDLMASAFKFKMNAGVSPTSLVSMLAVYFSFDFNFCTHEISMYNVCLLIYLTN